MKTQRASVYQGLVHPFEPVIDARSRVLVLGSFPSVQSRLNSFYYGHPQNRFWRVTAALFSQGVPGSIDDKTAFLRINRIALWDVVSACDITGSADSTLTPLKLNDIGSLLRGTQVRMIVCNGQKAGQLYRANLQEQIKIPMQVLPSTSPANAAWTLERLIKAWEPLLAAIE